jgi:excinuclease ABC subunit B
MFKLKSSFVPTGDQPQAIEKLTAGVSAGFKNQVLLGVTGSGKTFTMANVIKNLNMPALIISHNKTLAGQLYQEFRDFFPENAVSYFVSYYDFYQPEAYIPASDTYIEKEAQINEVIDKLRLQATTNILTRKDVIVVASVSCIYNIGSPKEYGGYIVEIEVGGEANWNKFGRKLVDIQYQRSDMEFRRGSFRVRGEYMDIYPAYEDFGYRIYSSSLVIPAKAGILKSLEQDSGLRRNDNGMNVLKINKIDPISGEEISGEIEKIVIYPAKHYLTNPDIFNKVEKNIRADLAKESEILKKAGKEFEAHRLIQKVNYDLEMIKEVGFVNGIENYSRYFDGRQPGDPPYTLIDYFKEAYGDNFLTIIDESHMTVSQIRGMYNGDHARKRILIDFGFRLESAIDNRPLKFEEFYLDVPKIVYVSATPNEWEIELAQNEQLNNRTIELSAKNKIQQFNSSTVQQFDGVVEQLIRPTGIVDPEVFVRPAKDEIADLIKEIEKRVGVAKSGVETHHDASLPGEKVAVGKTLVTTLTKKTAEDLSTYLKENDIRAEYLHSDIKTLERSDVLDNLRKNEFDVLIGVNLLREGLDLPEVTLVAILDADREGFLRSRVSLIQTMGRAARNINSQVILYADKITESMRLAMDEINRRRKYQMEYNTKHGIDPSSIVKPVREKIVDIETPSDLQDILSTKNKSPMSGYFENIKKDSLTPSDTKRLVKKLELEMKKAADNLDFELAIRMRDKARELSDL